MPLTESTSQEAEDRQDLSPSSCPTAQFFLLLSFLRQAQKGKNITVILFHQAVWHRPEDLVSGLSVHTIPCVKAFSENKTLTRRQDGSSS